MSPTTTREQVSLDSLRQAVAESLALCGLFIADQDGVIAAGPDRRRTGISISENLFVPFYTTKPEGIGIGFALSRQIAEAHGGTLTLENRKEGRGCEALLCLPA